MAPTNGQLTTDKGQRMHFKFGKKPARKDHRDLLFKRFSIAPLPLAEPGFGHGNLVPQWGMLANDQYGDCVCAAACHQSMLWTACASDEATFGDAQALKIYSDVTGFNPNEPSTDNGTDLRDCLTY